MGQGARGMGQEDATIKRKALFLWERGFGREAF